MTDERLEGTMLGRYRVGRLLGSGGMGAVHAGVQEPLGRPVAIKVLRPEIASHADVAARFRREAELAASLSHPHIAQVTDFGVERGRAYLVMDLLEGESLADLLAREGRLSEARAQRIALQILTALSVAHERGVVHRDLKPENVFVQQVSGMELVKLLDFGIARVLDVDSSMTHTGAVLGTPAYMSPEQARGRRVDARSDVFSLGAVLYQMLAGRRAFDATNYHELMFAIVEESPPPLAARDPGISPPLAALIERAMSKSPEARFASAREMREALAALTGLRERTSPIGVEAVAPDPPARDASTGAFAATMPSQPDAPRPPARRRVAVIALFAALATLVAWLAVAALRAPDTPRPAAASAPPDAAPPMQPIPSEAEPRAALDAPSEPAAADEGSDAPGLGTASRDDPEQTERRAGARRVAADERCGGYERRVVGRNDRVVAAAAEGLAGVREAGGISVLRAAVNQRSEALGRCYRGHAIGRGQHIGIFASADGAVQRLEQETPCATVPAVRACVERALSTLALPATGSGPLSFRVGLDVSRRP